MISRFPKKRFNGYGHTIEEAIFVLQQNIIGIDNLSFIPKIMTADHFYVLEWRRKSILAEVMEYEWVYKICISKRKMDDGKDFYTASILFRHKRNKIYFRRASATKINRETEYYDRKEIEKLKKE